MTSKQALKQITDFAIDFALNYNLKRDIYDKSGIIEKDLEILQIIKKKPQATLYMFTLKENYVSLIPIKSVNN